MLEDAGISKDAENAPGDKSVAPGVVNFSVARGGLAAAAGAAPAPAMPTTPFARGPGPGVDGPGPAESGKPGGAAAPLVQPTVRTKFADTALWVGSLTTNEKGEAEVSLDMPENLTTWKIKVWGMGHGTKVGQGEAEVVTRKDLIVRLQAPRFFVEKDEVVLSANVHNYLKTKKKVQVSLEFVGKQLSDQGDSVKEIEVPAGEESRVDWRVKVVREGEATIRMNAMTDEESDAVEQKFPVYVHGMLKMDSFAGALRPKDEAGHITIEVPEKRRQGRSELEVRYSPTLAGAMVDALPYLVDYPYGCTEQTLNRFLPTVITQKVLLRMGLDLKKIAEKRTNLNAQEIGDDKQRPAGFGMWKRRPAALPDAARRRVHMIAIRSSTTTKSARWCKTASKNLRRCNWPMAAGAGSPASASSRGLTRRPWSFTACKWPSKTTWLWCRACWSAARSGSSIIKSSRYNS